MKYYDIFCEGSHINQIICAVLINLPVLAYGASIGWMSPMTLLLQSENSPKGVPLTDAEVSWMAGAPYLVCIPANLMVAALADRVGRKNTLLFISVTGIVSWALMLSSLETWALILARSLVGVTMAGAYVLCTTYTKEISDDSIRGALGCLVILFHTTGNLFLYIVGDLLDYNEILWLCLSIPAIHFLIFFFMPDSPSYLVKKGKIEAATKAISWLKCKCTTDSVVQEELNLIAKEQQKDEEPLLFVSSLISGLSMCTLATWFLLRDYGVLTPSWIPLLMLCTCIFCDSCGLQPMSIVLASEIFAFKYRGTVMATSMSIASLFDFFQLLFFKPLANTVGIHAPFYFFGLICLLMAAYVIFVIPETKGRCLTDIYKDLAKKSGVKENQVE